MLQLLPYYFSLQYEWIIDYSTGVDTVVWMTSTCSLIISVLNVSKWLIIAPVWTLLYGRQAGVLLLFLFWMWLTHWSQHKCRYCCMDGKHLFLYYFSFECNWIFDHSRAVGTVVWITSTCFLIISLLNVTESVITALMWALFYGRQAGVPSLFLLWMWLSQWSQQSYGHYFMDDKVFSRYFSFECDWVSDHSTDVGIVLWKTSRCSLIISPLNVTESVITAELWALFYGWQVAVPSLFLLWMWLSQWSQQSYGHYFMDDK